MLADGTFRILCVKKQRHLGGHSFSDKLFYLLLDC